MDFAALSTALSTGLITAEEEHLRDIGINPYAVGGLALLALLLLVVALLVFGKGREHS